MEFTDVSPHPAEEGFVGSSKESISEGHQDAQEHGSVMGTCLQSEKLRRSTAKDIGGLVVDYESLHSIGIGSLILWDMDPLPT